MISIPVPGSPTASVPRLAARALACLLALATALAPAKEKDDKDKKHDVSDTYLSVRNFGAKGDGVTDDAPAINAAIAAAKLDGYRTLFFPTGIYKILSPLDQLNSSFEVVNVLGENARLTTIDGSALGAGVPLMRTFGGSGILTNSEIKNLTFLGSQTQIGFRNQGTCGLTIINCVFAQLAIGIEFNNSINPQTFTEYSVAERCNFKSTCLTPVKYKRGVGNPSFNGTGLRASYIDNGQTVTGAAVVIGDPGEQCFVYNAPMDFQIWTRAIAHIIEVAQATSSVLTHGTITVEQFAAPSTVGGGAGTINHTGGLVVWGDVRYGKLVLADAAKRNSDGSVNANRKPFNLEQTLNTATTALAVAAQPHGTVLSVVLTANNYDVRFQLLVTHQGYGGAGYIHSLIGVETTGAPKAIVVANGAGLGVPTLSLNASGQLVITNASYATTPVLARITVNPLGLRREFYWK